MAAGRELVPQAAAGDVGEAPPVRGAGRAAFLRGLAIAAPRAEGAGLSERDAAWAAPVLAALLEDGPAGGEALVDALVLGGDLAAQVAAALGAAEDDAGRAQRLGAAAGAALAVGLMAGLEPPELAIAVGIACCQAPGIVRPGGPWGPAYVAGRAAENAVLSVDLARRGFTGPTDVLGHPRGLVAAVTAGCPPASQEGAPDGATWRRLAEFTVDAPWPPQDAGVATAARCTAANVLALAIASERWEPAVSLLGAAVRADADDPGAGAGGAPAHRPLLTATAMHVLDFDDTHLEVMVHPGAPVVGAALHAALAVGATGLEFVAAVAVGVEVALRTGRALGRAHLDRGWHPTASAGRVGAAAAVARLWGLAAPAAARALAVAASCGAGLVCAAGTMTKALQVGRAAADGMEAATVAASLDGLGDVPLDAYLRALGVAGGVAGAACDAATRGLGTGWLLLGNAFKAYACGIVAHAAIDAAREARAVIPADEVRSIVLTVNPLVRRAMGIAEPAGELEAKFSVAHCVAVGYLDDAAGPEQFRDERVRAPDVARLRALVALELDDAVRLDEARATITADGDRRFQIHVEHARGSVGRPMSEADLRSKAYALLRPLLGDATAAAVDALFAVDGREPLADLLPAASLPAADPSPI